MRTSGGKGAALGQQGITISSTEKETEVFQLGTGYFCTTLTATYQQ
jgi:hypothetical protein